MYIQKDFSSDVEESGGPPCAKVIRIFEGVFLFTVRRLLESLHSDLCFLFQSCFWCSGEQYATPIMRIEIRQRVELYTKDCVDVPQQELQYESLTPAEASCSFPHSAHDSKCFPPTSIRSATAEEGQKIGLMNDTVVFARR